MGHEVGEAAELRARRRLARRERVIPGEAAGQRQSTSKRGEQSKRRAKGRKREGEGRQHRRVRSRSSSVGV